MKKSLLLIWIIALFNITCIVKSNNQYHYQKPEEIHDGLKAGSLAEVGISKGAIESAALKILSGRFKEVHAMLIAKDGKLFFKNISPVMIINGMHHIITERLSIGMETHLIISCLIPRVLPRRVLELP